MRTHLFSSLLSLSPLLLSPLLSPPLRCRQAPVLTGGITLGTLAGYLRSSMELHKTVLTTDDINLLAPRAAWEAVASLRRGKFECYRLCSERFWAWMPGVRTHCLMKAHFAKHGVHHIELQGAAAFEDVLHAKRLPRHAPPLRTSYECNGKDLDALLHLDARDSILAKEALVAMCASVGHDGNSSSLAPQWLPALQLQIGNYEVLRAVLPKAKPPRLAKALGMALTCSLGSAVQPMPCTGTTSKAAAASAGATSAPAASAASASAASTAAICSLCTTPRWLGLPPMLIHEGFCETAEGEGDCSRGQKGAWEMGGAGEAVDAKGRGLTIVGAAPCVRRCEACSRCRYISFSQNHEDCSWYHSCDLSKLQLPTGAESFRTMQVRSTHDGQMPARVSPPDGAHQCPDQPAVTWSPAASAPCIAGSGDHSAADGRFTAGALTAGGGRASTALAASTVPADVNMSSASDATALGEPSEFLLSHFKGKDPVYATVAAACGIAMRASLRAARRVLEQGKERSGKEGSGKGRSGKERAEPAAGQPAAEAAHEVYSAALAKMLSAEGRLRGRGAGTHPSRDGTAAAAAAVDSPTVNVMDSSTQAAVMALARRSLRAVPLLRACARPSKPSQWRPAMWQLASGSGGFGVLRLGPAEVEALLLRHARSIRRSTSITCGKLWRTCL